MRPIVILGLILAVVGTIVGLNGGVIRSSNRSVFRVGEFEARVEEQKRIPPWVGWTCAAFGLGLVIAGYRRRVT